MPEDAPPPANPPEVSQPAAAPGNASSSFDIAEEFGTAKKNLPPAKIVLIGIGALAIIAAVVALVQKPRQQASGSIDNIVVVGVPDQQQVLVAIGLTVQNRGQKPYVIHNLQADLQAEGGPFTADPASGVDFERYFQAFPALKAGALEPLKLETRIEPGAQVQGTIIVGFPVTQQTFDGRKSLKVTISPLDYPVQLELKK
jgi:hypothetical protein